MTKRKKLAALFSAVVLLAATAACAPGEEEPASGTVSQPAAEVMSFSESESPLYNPLMGFAAEADYEKSVGENTLVYIEVLWKDIEPEEGVYDFAGLEARNHLDRWRAAGKHAVLRFICYKPGREAHMDIPQWLYDKTGDGTHYAYDSTHKGYSPDYNNPVLIEAHARAVAALGAHFGQDTFVSYVELGSLGHWGEWHVKYDAGIVRMPKEAVREQYVVPYIAAFPNAKMLMRRPFNTAVKYGFGLYDDTAGNPEATADWLNWIRNGGDYSQAEEADALSPMADAWKAAPIGGEFNSDLTMTEMLTTGLNITLSLLEGSHTTFLGPNFPNGLSPENGQGCEAGIDAVRKRIGYRLWISQSACILPAEGRAGEITLTWRNSGIAPMYWDWPAFLYFYDADQKPLGKYPVDVKLTQALPGQERKSVTQLEAGGIAERAAFICVGIEDPMTGKPAVTLAMEAERVDGLPVVYKDK